MKIGKYLKIKRLEAGLSQKDVAKALNYRSAQLVSNWERGLCQPPPSKFRKLASIYGLDKTEFIEWMVAGYRRGLYKNLGQLFLFQVDKI